MMAEALRSCHHFVVCFFTIFPENIVLEGGISFWNTCIICDTAVTHIYSTRLSMVVISGVLQEATTELFYPVTWKSLGTRRCFFSAYFTAPVASSSSAARTQSKEMPSASSCSKIEHALCKSPGAENAFFWDMSSPCSAHESRNPWIFFCPL